jgi:formylmethanofuran dehydrogenase subunit E
MMSLHTLSNMGKEKDDLPGGHYVVPFSQAVKFHGHICPGLAIGYYASHMAMRWLAAEKSPEDEVFAVLESSGCGADAVQAITGCTVGKGNLVIDDIGKQVYTFGIRGRPKAIRIALRPGFATDRLDPGLPELNGKAASGKASDDEVRDLRHRIERVCRAILESPGEAVFEIREADAREPARQGMPVMVVCAKCGELVTMGRAKKSGSGHLCPACVKAKT